MALWPLCLLSVLRVPFVRSSLATRHSPLSGPRCAAPNFHLATAHPLLATFRRSMPIAEKSTPMMQQYFEVRRALPRDTLLLFRLGDFFELFFDDAVTASRLLGLTLTKRQDHPMAGLPAQALDN